MLARGQRPVTSPAPAAFGTDRVLSALARLFTRAPAADGVLVDLALDGGSSAGVAARLGLAHLAVREDLELSTSLRGGTEVLGGDPSDPRAIGGRLADALGGRLVAAVCIGDALNRVERLDDYLAGLQTLCARLGNVPLLLASPNVTHLDVAAKLLIGRWDVTPTGTLASDYVRHFSDRSLRVTMAAHGWQESGAEDLTSDESDQHFPEDAAPLERTTPLGALLRGLRESAAPGAHVDRLVRAYVASGWTDRRAGETSPPDPAEPTARARRLQDAGPAAPEPFLSVLVRTQGRREATLQEALLCLAAQTCDDFEVLVLLHDADAAAAASVQRLVSSYHDSFSRRVRIVEVAGGGRCRPLNEGAACALGRYVAMLDDDDLVLAHWVETFRAAATPFSGHVVRTAVATQRVEARHGAWEGREGYEVVDRPRLVFSLDFDHIDHILDNRTPNNGYAFPRSLVVDLGLRWDESLPVLEDWYHLLSAASACGVASVGTITALLRWWDQGEDSKSQHAPALWEATRRRVIDKHDSTPLLLDRGAFSRLRARLIDGDVAAEHAARLDHDVRRLSTELEAAQAQVASTAQQLQAMSASLQEIYESRSWRLTAGLRLATTAARRVARRARRLSR